MIGQCSKTVYDSTMRFPRGHKCKRKAVVERDGALFCKIHDPIAVKSRNEAKEAQWKRESDARCAQYRLNTAASDLLAACEAQHEAIDWLLARLIELDRGFMPAKSPVWPMLVQGNAAIAKARGQS